MMDALRTRAAHEVMAEWIANVAAWPCLAGDEPERGTLRRRAVRERGVMLAHAIESAFAVDGGDRDDHGVLHARRWARG